MRHFSLAITGIAGCLGLSAAIAGPVDGPQYKPPESWVLDPPPSVNSGVSTDAAVQIIYADNQTRISDDGTDEEYSAYRIKIMKPEGLSAGNIILSWDPEAGDITIHRVRLIRSDQPTDILSTTKFVVLQREGQLEQSMLTGVRTATLQVPGLQVGDELEVAVTVDKRVAGFGGRVAGLTQLPVAGTPGIFRFRLTWPLGHLLEWRATKRLFQKSARSSSI
jgi:hypothetical protein